MRTLQRGFLRAGISIRHTEGFHPHPYISIPLPLPLGFSSACEILEFGLLGGSTPEELPGLLTRALPAGLTVHRCYEGGLPFRRLCYVRYEIDLEFDKTLAEEAARAIKDITGRESHIIQKRSKKAKSGMTELDIIPLIHRVEVIEPQGDRLHLELLLHAQNPGLNPDLLLGALRTEFPHLTPAYSAFHRKEILDEAFNPYE
jgi:radical SAM-linked protein